MPALAVPGTDAVTPHLAADADRELLAQLARATEWWASQHTWRLDTLEPAGEEQAVHLLGAARP